MIQLRYSNDGGHNWSGWRNFPEPVTGAFLQPLVVRRLGLARHRIWELRDTSDTPQDLIAAAIYMEAE